MYDLKEIVTALRTHLITLDELPAAQYRAWTNVKFDPTAGQAFIEDEFVPGPSALKSFPADGGQGELLPLYVLRWNFVEHTGLAPLSSISALLAHFATGTTLYDASDNRIRVRGGEKEPGPFASTLIKVKPGWMTSTITIPLRVDFRNAVPA